MNGLFAAPFFAKGLHDKSPRQRSQAQSEAGRTNMSENFYCCIGCQTPIASAALIPVNGKPEHTFANPGGEVFHIGCFPAAMHLSPVTAPTDVFSWFPGYAWQIVVCAKCGLHLGWHYVGPTRFFGLILNRLILQQRDIT